MRSGIVIAIFSALLFGATPPLIKIMLGSVEPRVMAGLLYLGAGLGLAVVHLGRAAVGLPAVEAPLRRADMPWMAAVIVAGGIMGPLFLLFGLERTTASGASLLLNLEGLATMGIAWVVFHENVDRRLLIGAFSILGGAVLLSWRGGASLDWGAILIALACLSWGIDNNLTRRLSASDPVEIAMVKGLVAGTVNLALALAAGGVLPNAAGIAEAVIVGFLGYGVSIVLFVLALRHLGTARTGAYFALAPFVGAVLSLVLLGEPLTVSLVAAGFLMAVGIWLHLTERHGHEHAHDTLDHEHAHRHDAHHQHEHAPGDPAGEPHSHPHRHRPLTHSHAHYPDLHHRHRHG
jgi:drug/metabolite transporter (DMT)-like permease